MLILHVFISYMYSIWKFPYRGPKTTQTYYDPCCGTYRDSHLGGPKLLKTPINVHVYSIDVHIYIHIYIHVHVYDIYIYIFIYLFIYLCIVINVRICKYYIYIYISSLRPPKKIHSCSVSMPPLPNFQELSCFQISTCTAPRL